MYGNGFELDLPSLVSLGYNGYSRLFEGLVEGIYSKLLRTKTILGAPRGSTSHGVGGVAKME